MGLDNINWNIDTSQIVPPIKDLIVTTHPSDLSYRTNHHQRIDNPMIINNNKIEQ